MTSTNVYGDEPKAETVKSALDWDVLRDNVRKRPLAALGITAIAGVALTGFLTVGGGGGVTVQGEIETTQVYSDLLLGGLPAPTCGHHEVQVKDGSGAVLRVGKSEVADESLSDPESSVHTLTCTSTYSLDVPKSDVYIVGVPAAEEVAMFGTYEQTVNREDKDTVDVDLIDYMYDSP